MSVTVTVTFATAAEAAAFLAGNAKTSKPAAETSKAADTPRTAEAAAPQGDAQPTKAYDFDKDVLPALQAYAKKVSREVFTANIMKAFGVAKVPELKAKPETFGKLMQICAA